MARSGDVLENPVTGDRIVFLQTAVETELGRPTRPPASVQRLLFAPLAALGRARGYRATYPQYSGTS
jgi:hypothetical protein